MKIFRPATILVMALFFASPLFCQAQPAKEMSKQIAVIKAVDHDGVGHAQARQAIQQLQQNNNQALLPILYAMDDANPLASNWLRSAFETIASRSLKNKQPLPEEDLLNFLRKTSHRPESRRLAFEWLRKVDSAEAEKMVDFFINDPSDELRRETVAQYIEQAEKIKKVNPEDKKSICAFYQKAILGASDDDQVRKIIAGLKECDIEIDLQHHYGFLNTWNLIGPFNNREKVGFAIAYPPEKELNLSATYPSNYSEEIKEVSWKQHKTDDSYGVLDLATQIAPHKGAINYATTEFISEEDQPVEFRLAENTGMIFIDEIDKICGSSESGKNADVSRQGVQRDLLPIVEGTNVQTKFGTVNTEYMLFIAAGAFHQSRPSDLMPELQGRFPIRVELQDLTRDDFVRILTEPTNSLTQQYHDLLAIDGVNVTYTTEGIETLADIASQVNQSTQNIGARRLHTILERLLDSVSFQAPDDSLSEVIVDAEYVRDQLHEIAQDEDLSKFIL